MHFPFYSIVLPILAFTYPNAASILKPRDKGVYICCGPKWSVRCKLYQPNLDAPNACYGMPCEAYQIISFGPDPGVACTVYTSKQCEEKPGDSKKDIGWPGNDALPGPSYQGGQGTQYSPAYQGYKCSKQDAASALGIRQSTPAVYIWCNTFWYGPWIRQVPAYDVCNPISCETYQYLSFGPDLGLTCMLYEDKNCVAKGRERPIKHPGSYELMGPAFMDGKGTKLDPAFRAYSCIQV